MKRLLALALTILATQLRAVPTEVNTLGENGLDAALSLQGIINSRVAGGSSNVSIQSDQAEFDGLWTTNGQNTQVSLIMEVAGYRDGNAFGIYNPITNDLVELFQGQVGEGVTGTIPAGWTVFGFYIQNTNVGFTWYSETSRNTDGGKDHMVAYQGAGESLAFGTSSSVLWDSDTYLLGWEDLSGLGDYDYNDMILTVSGIRPVPDSGATAVLFGAALVGLVLVRRRPLVRNA